MNDLPITPEMDRRNGRLYLLMYLLIFLAAPVSYIGVVQAALCDRLGSNATVANLPFATYLLGGIAPFFLSLIVPHRHERSVVVCANGLTACFIGLVFVTLVLRLPPWIPLTVVIVQSLLQGFTSSSAHVFTFQCLARGTTLQGRNRTFKKTYFLSPIFAVIGSLWAQFVLQGSLHNVRFPYDFALLYAVSFVCMAGVTLFSSRFILAPVPDKPPASLIQELKSGIRQYTASRPLVLLFIVYTLWYAALSITPSLALYTRHVLGRDPKELSGIIMALRFGCKSLGGYLLGSIALRWGLRASVLVSCWLLAAGTVWGSAVPGYAFLFAFGLLGAGELGGAYIPNYCISLSTPQTTARNIALLNLASPASSFAPALFGILADRVGFGSSFALAFTMILTAVWLTFTIRESKPPVVESVAGS